MSLDDRLNASLLDKKNKNLFRRRRIRNYKNLPTINIDGRSRLNFCSNDYLGLASHPEVIEAAYITMQKFGVGSGAAALITGHSTAHQELEEFLADYTDRSRVLLFSSGFAANCGIIPALVKRYDHLFMDRLCHASLIDGARLCAAKIHRYKHLDVADLADKLDSKVISSSNQQSEKISWVITESLFSMDGDRINLKEIAGITNQSQGSLYLDDAHGFGIYGKKGAGSLAEAGLSQSEVPVLVATFGKALGVAGAFVAGSADLIDYLIQNARSYVYSTAPPPALAAAILKSLKICRKEEWRREMLFDQITYFRNKAIVMGIPLQDDTTGPVQPVIIGDSSKALNISQALLKHNILVTAIRPPTVQRGSARLRITISAVHEKKHIDQLLKALASVL